MTSISRKAAAIVIALVTLAVVIITTSSVTILLLGNGTSSYALDDPETELEERYERLDEVYNILMDEYYTEVDSDTLIQGAIDGMMASLDDPYTYYYTPELMQETNEKRVGTYVGIGVQISIFGDGDLYVIRVFKDGPAYEAGLKRGDIILSADGVELNPTNSQELTDAVALIKGEEGTTVLLSIKRGDEVFDVEVERSAVLNTKVEYEMLDENTGYIALYEFFGTAVSQVQEAVDDLTSQGMTKLVFDLRDNGGGQLDICTEITDMFVPEGIIVYTEDRQLNRVYYNADDEYNDIPLVVLINENTASASEIFASAVQDSGRGVLVGQTTYGKGIVQTQYQFPVDGAGMQLTTSVYYTRSGKCIHKQGVQPDIEVEAEEITIEDYVSGPSIESDSQLRAAYEYLNTIGE